jgi:hypothetical protein
MKTTKNHIPAAIALLVCCLLAPSAFAQKVYRCGSVYSQTPCEGATTVDVNDSRTAAQKKEAESAIARDEKTAKAMETNRVKQEKQLAAQNSAAQKETTQRKLTVEQAAEEKHPAHHIKKPKKGTKEPEFFTAATGKKEAEKKSDKP